VAPPPAAARPAAAPASTTPAAARALVSRVPARFPESALRRRLEGEVEVAVRIRPDGSVANVEVVRADPPGVFDREAVLAVRRWRYAEAATESETRVVLQFRRP
jgi:protein TonB